MADAIRESVLAVLGASVGLAGLLLVFVGFVYGRAETFDTRRGDIYRYVAKAGLIPFLASLVCAWLCLDAVICDESFVPSIVAFRVTLIATGLYGVIALLFYL
jgi:hypothetical protein